MNTIERSRLAFVLVGLVLIAIVVLLSCSNATPHGTDRVRQERPLWTPPPAPSSTFDVYRNLRVSVEQYCLSRGRGHGRVDSDGTARCDR